MDFISKPGSVVANNVNGLLLLNSSSSSKKDNNPKNGLSSNQKSLTPSSPTATPSSPSPVTASNNGTNLVNNSSTNNNANSGTSDDDPETNKIQKKSLIVECQNIGYVHKICNEHEPEVIDEVKPLLDVVKKPKGIVKSLSNQSFGRDKLSRLSLNIVEEEEPPINRHVQFHQNEDGEVLEQPLEAEDGQKTPLGSIISGSSGSSSSSSESSSSSYSEARPPDGGWGWVVVFASFMVNLIADGITFSFGVIYVEFLNYFGEGKSKTAWIGSLFMAMPLLSGPIASFLTDRYGCKKVTIVGSLLASSGFVISAFATSIEVLFLTFGVLAGFGLSLCYVAAVVVVAYYFDKRRSFATGLSVCGSGIGTFIFAPLTQILLDEYGWRGTTLILAGIFLNMCVFGMLMRDLEWTTHKSKLKRKQQQQEKMSADSCSFSNSTNTGGTTTNLNGGTMTGDGLKLEELELADPENTRLFSSLITLPTFVKNGEKVPIEVLELLSKHRNVHEHVLQNYPNLLHSRSFSQQMMTTHEVTPEISNHQLNNLPEGDQVMHHHPFLKRINSHRNRSGTRTPTTAFLKDMKMHRHSLTYRGAMLNIQRYRLRASSCPDIYRNSMTTIAKEKTAWYQGVEEFKALLVSILDFSYFADIRFLLFAMSNFLLYTWYDVPYVFLTDSAIEMGFSESDSSRLVGMIGIVNMFGEIILGWAGDRKEVSANCIYAICMGLCGVVVAIVPLLDSYWSLCLASGLFGLFIAANYSLTSIILVELITLEKFTNAYGLLLLVQGIANLVGPPIGGWLYDVTGKYDLSFYLAGLFIALSGGLLLVLPAVGKYKKFCEFKRRLPEAQNNNSYKMNNLTQIKLNNSNGAVIMNNKIGNNLIKDTAVNV